MPLGAAVAVGDGWPGQGMVSSVGLGCVVGLVGYKDLRLAAKSISYICSWNFFSIWFSLGFCFCFSFSLPFCFSTFISTAFRIRAKSKFHVHYT